MLDSPDEIVPVANTAPVSPPDAIVPEIIAQAADAILGPLPLKKPAQDSTRTAPPLVGRLLRYTLRAAMLACLCGLAWAGGWYYSRGYAPFDALKPQPAAAVQQDAGRDEMLGTMREMAEEIRTLKASVEAIGAARGAGAQDAVPGDSLKTQLDSMQTRTSAALADLAGRIDRLESASTAKLSQLSAQLDGIEHQVAAPPRKRAEGLHDAFDPTRDPTAPGAPRPLGSLVTASPTGQYTH